MVELLAPAGDITRAKFAYLYGASAVYIGGVNYSLRANAHNFSNEEIKELVIFAHKLNKKVYVAVNIIFHNRELKGLREYLKYLDSIKVDGIIASDICVLKFVKELGLNLHITLSTQASCMSLYTASFYKNLGVKRIVTARECFKKDIMNIKNSGIEVEVFIHGAMCTSFSGKCVLSNYMTNRDSNRGGCAQICRWPFKVDSSPDLTIMSKDLNMIKHIQELMNIHVDSFKIEGRMRSIYYIATIIYCYRHIIDKIEKNTLSECEEKYYLSILNRCANRESSPQFFETLPGVNEEYYSDRVEVTNQDFLGLVIDANDNEIIIEVRNYFEVGSKVEFFGPNIEEVEYTIKSMKDEDDNLVNVANHPKSIIKLEKIANINKYCIMRLKVFDKKDFL